MTPSPPYVKPEKVADVGFWWNNGRGHPHADPELERKSAQMIGRLDEACDQLDQLLLEFREATGELSIQEVQEEAQRQREQHGR